MAHVAFVGTGKIGAAMCTRLLDAGNRLTVWNRTASKVDPLLERGASVAKTPADAAAKGDYVFISMADPAALREVLVEREDGVLAGVRPGSIVIDTSTVDPGTSREMAEAVNKVGAAFLDIPVGGSSELAAEGKLLLMAGGDETVLENARPVLEDLGRELINFGPVGSGSAAKLALNALLGMLNQSVAEAYVLGLRLGLQKERLLDLLCESPAGAQVARKRERMSSGDYPPSFRLVLMLKDLELAMQSAPDLAALRVAVDALRDAVAAGMGDEDYSAVTKLLLS